MTPKSATIVCRGLAPEEEDAYIAFAREAWGADSVQATPGRLRWLYEGNPNTRRTSSRIPLFCGTVRELSGPASHEAVLESDDKGVVVPSVHDLAVLKQHRRGLQFILVAFAGEPHVALFGMGGVSDGIYARMRIPSIPMRWAQCRRHLIATSLHVLKSRLSRPTIGILSGAEIVSDGYSFTRSAKPGIQELADALSIQDAHLDHSPDAYVAWDLPSFKWRFFDDRGPLNILVLARSGTAPVGRAVLSLGLRHGLLVARVVDLAATASSCYAPLFDIVERTLREVGACFAFFVTSCDQLAHGRPSRDGQRGTIRLAHVGFRATPQRCLIHTGFMAGHGISVAIRAPTNARYPRSIILWRNNAVNENLLTTVSEVY